MEASALPATPSPATPLSGQDAKTRSAVVTRRPPLIHAFAYTRPGDEFESSGTSTASPAIPVSHSMVTFARQTFQTIRKKVTRSLE